MKYKKVLVTGGAGFIGSYIVDSLILKGYRVRILDSLDPQVHPGRKRPEYLNSKAEFVLGDVTKRKDWLKAINGVDAIYHQAAAVGVGQSMYRIKHYTKVNTYGTSILLDLLANTKHSVKKIIIAASMSSYGEGVYLCTRHGKIRPGPRLEKMTKKGYWDPTCPIGGEKITPIGILEDDIQLCNSIYAINKKDQEDMIMLFGRAYGIPTVALRYFNVYGPRQSLSNPYTGVAAIFLSRLLSGHSPVIYEDGKQTRDFVSVHDISAANILSLESDKADGKVFNVGTGKPISVIEIAEKIRSLLNLKIKPTITEKYRAGDIRHCFPDISKIKKVIGFRPAVSFTQGMAELIDWSRSQKPKDKYNLAVQKLRSKGLG